MDVEEVNFWQPGGSRRFSALSEGDLFLFKLHAPHHFIVGGGVFAYSTLLPVSMAWETFGVANGVRSLREMRERIEQYRAESPNPLEDYTIGCILLTQPFFWPESQWIPVPSDWKINIVQGKTYDLSSGLGLNLFKDVHNRLSILAVSGTSSPSIVTEERFGTPVLITPRLGQGTFRLEVTDAYNRRCAVSGEKVLPVLQAAHIRPYAEGGAHRTDNGLLLRSDLHTLFDRGYITISSDYRLEVSRRIKEDYENGREYYAFHGNLISLPQRTQDHPSNENIHWHNDHYLG
jgi:putative restriction endonuclease